MHPHIRKPPYRPPAFAPCADPDAPIQLPVDLSPARLADVAAPRLRRARGTPAAERRPPRPWRGGARGQGRALRAALTRRP